VFVTQVPGLPTSFQQRLDCHGPGYLTAMPVPEHDIAGALGNGSWGYIVGTYARDAGPNNQRRYLNGARVTQMSAPQPLDLPSAPLASDGM
jgi:hypothetical protein